MLGLCHLGVDSLSAWIPACAGMTGVGGNDGFYQRLKPVPESAPVLACVLSYYLECLVLLQRLVDHTKCFSVLLNARIRLFCCLPVN